MRLCYKGTWISPEPQWYWEGSRQVWEARVLLEGEAPDSLFCREIVAPGKFYKEDAALRAGIEYVKQLIDGGGKT